MYVSNTSGQNTHVCSTAKGEACVNTCTWRLEDVQEVCKYREVCRNRMHAARTLTRARRAVVRQEDRRKKHAAKAFSWGFRANYPDLWENKCLHKYADEAFIQGFLGISRDLLANKRLHKYAEKALTRGFSPINSNLRVSKHLHNDPAKALIRVFRTTNLAFGRAIALCNYVTGMMRCCPRAAKNQPSGEQSFYASTSLGCSVTALWRTTIPSGEKMPMQVHLE